MKITLINQPTNNRGDEAAHRSLVRGLNQLLPNAIVTTLFIGRYSQSTVEQMRVNSHQNVYVNISLPKIMVKYNIFRRLLVNYCLFGFIWICPGYRKFIKYLKDADIVINAPGGICMGGFQDWSHILHLFLALRYNKKVFYYSRSIGPFSENTKRESAFKKKSIEVLRELKFISLRDTRSIQIAQGLDVNNILSTVDTVFLGPPPHISIPNELESIFSEDYVVIVPNQLTWHPAFVKMQQEIIDDVYVTILQSILTRYPDYKIIMLPQLFNVSNSDEKYFSYLKSRIPNNRIVVLPEIFSSDIQQHIIANSKLMVGARYHSVVFAINNKVPFIALSYEHKVSGMLDMLGLCDLCVNINKIGSDREENKVVINEFFDKLQKILYVEQNIKLACQQANGIAKKCIDAAVKTMVEIGSAS